MLKIKFKNAKSKLPEISQELDTNWNHNCLGSSLTTISRSFIVKNKTISYLKTIRLILGGQVYKRLENLLYNHKIE